MPDSLNPPGVRTVRKRLADGTVKTYSYSKDRKKAGKASYYGPGTVAALIVAYQSSQEWLGLAATTRTNYTLYLADLMDFRDTPVREVTRRHILDVRDMISSRSGNGAAAVFLRVASALFSWAIERGLADLNPAARIRTLKGGHLPAWSVLEAELGMGLLPVPLARAVLLGMYTGQRRADLCALKWSGYDGRIIRLTQQKTKVRLAVPVHPRLKLAMDEWRKSARTDHVLEGARGNPWTPKQLSSQMRAVGRRVGLPHGLNVHGLRKLAATMLAEAGCSTHEIASITGHKTLSMVQLYTASVSQERLAEQAVSRLQTAVCTTAKTEVLVD